MIAAGDDMPSVNVKLIGEDGASDADSADIFRDGRTVVFSVPGAFTPTCHANHLPGYVQLADEILAKGIDRIICLTANDHHVVKAWAEASDALGKIAFIADGNAELVKALGIDRDMTGGGMGVRAARTAMIIRDGRLEAIYTEDSPGQVTSSGAPAILEKLG